MTSLHLKRELCKLESKIQKILVIILRWKETQFWHHWAFCVLHIHSMAWRRLASGLEFFTNCKDGTKRKIALADLTWLAFWRTIRKLLKRCIYITKCIPNAKMEHPIIYIGLHSWFLRKIIMALQSDVWVWNLNFGTANFACEQTDFKVFYTQNLNCYLLEVRKIICNINDFYLLERGKSFSGKFLLLRSESLSVCIYIRNINCRRENNCFRTRKR